MKLFSGCEIYILKNNARILRNYFKILQNNQADDVENVQFQCLLFMGGWPVR